MRSYILKRIKAYILSSCFVALAVTIFSWSAMAQQGNKMSKDEKIANAMSAAPASVSANATIIDWPENEGDKPTILRQGTNGWACYPDMPTTKGNDPMCLDAQWQAWAKAYMNHEKPNVTAIGISYMLNSEGWGSNTDPYAAAETSDNEWGYDGSHMMILVPDPVMLEGIPTKRNSGGPYVMWRGTPYVHIMVPVNEESKM